MTLHRMWPRFNLSTPRPSDCGSKHRANTFRGYLFFVLNFYPPNRHCVWRFLLNLHVVYAYRYQLTCARLDMAVDVTESELEAMCKDGEMASTWMMSLFTLFMEYSRCRGYINFVVVVMSQIFCIRRIL